MPLALAEFNSASAAELRPMLTACLAVRRWVDTVLEGRPYADFAALSTRADSATPLHRNEIRDAIAAHPRIGERPSGKGSDADWSRSEQSGVDNADEFAAANAEYEARFGHVFLVCASGRSGEELLANLRSRLGNDPDTELDVAGAELAKIAQLRLAKAVTA
ncbi:2-oxo-4-hydroxy-4-carboxy-5-ureidoimidazoline decarboxylase [Amycolatopsis rubida]|uniref:2-oxo-4-hydroxy-4-carboxy-5-ureidoimidazoline decarboxylase n=1 Tax=Amycolatopsis rubida TaxID=112413 RepID=A0ABX0BYL7_9PSEU|nr:MULTISPECIES: 2-oxo-4-hydroxy-4-carboxy-5-ureidoimidazoline decarboxylase [Amycolatopsis]MYW95705.1 2-oxo-4-hydroxy-4-carboxy-5-ureidoimidazoline decarboxylase [Amycolatopsis rubida]NEC60694.1 2-oxo-4-hydroxy-4-carboxy-5-ureidoimidazoline decarboxylase [Amycolatopsis rubida]OAP22358.1 Uric acid degradation bifunctional protein PucL [Amycolatopsis sp. M39]